MVSATRARTSATSVTSFGREALGGLVDEQKNVVPQQDPRQSDHLLLSAGQGAGALPPSGDEVREQLADHRAPAPTSRPTSRRFSSTVRPPKTSRSSGT